MKIKILCIAGLVFCSKIIAQTTVTDIDGNTYNTITIGTQVWMKENLKTTKYNDSTNIQNITGSIQWTTTNPAYCWYSNNETTYKNTFGALYNWYAVNTGKLCPFGWHVPSDSDWSILTDYLGGENAAGGMLKEAGISHWQTPNTGANNSSKFSALPGGGRWNPDNNNFLVAGSTASFWSATENGSEDAYSRILYHDDNSVNHDYNSKYNGFSVRCVKDKHPYASDKPILIPKKFEISGVESAWHITFEPDGKTFYFISGYNKMSTIFYSQFKEGSWSVAKPTKFVNHATENPRVSPDGKKLFFTNAKIGSENLLVMTKNDSSWTNVTDLGSPVNGSSFEAGCSIAENGNIYFFSDRNGIFKIYFSKLENEKYTVPQAINFFPNSVCYSPFIAPDESYILFSVEIQEGLSNIFISFKKNDNGWSTPRNLGNRVNSASFQDRACISPDGNYLFFNRDWIYQVDWKPIIDSIRSVTNNINKSETAENIISYNQSAKTIHINLGNEELQNSELSVYDLNGRLIIKSESINSKSIRVDSPILTKGVFVVRLKTKKHYFTGKIIIN